MTIWLIVLLLLTILFIVYSTVKWRLHPFLALIFAAFIYGILSGMKFGDILSS
ncbi:MAG: GntP family permease, partial [Thermosipho sp. (in: Bacteria)]|nr:GntP family permease [Thermosipho sp. (in: thermotogales)]